VILSDGARSRSGNPDDHDQRLHLLCPPIHERGNCDDEKKLKKNLESRTILSSITF
jgi:hypothetical protein